MAKESKPLPMAKRKKVEILPQYQKIDKVQFERLCQLGCTLEEIAFFFQVGKDVITDFVRYTYNADFETVFSWFFSRTKIALRRMQIKTAMDGNVNMLLHLGKVLLGQKEERIEPVKIVFEFTDSSNKEKDENESSQSEGDAGISFQFE
jgi:hypothetical protein